ncbi:hypothetical protein F5051DRAFT_373848 [Lentinula edodes]|nr:hypothetical protein F5051DRAFT_373848 [Lentinula edodes]
MLPAEIKFVWNTKLRPLNVLYILQRYMPFIDTIAFASTASLVRPMNPDTCRVLVNISGWMSLAGIALTEVVLTVRTWALWENDSRLSFGLPIFFVCCWAPSFYILNVFLQTQTFIPSPFPQEFGCTYLGGQSVFYLCWVLLTVYEAGMLLLMLIPAIKSFRSGRWFALTRIVYRDGITYYIVLFAWSAMNVVTIILLSHTALETLFNSYQRVIHTVLTSRAILHMRRQSHWQGSGLDDSEG